MLDLRDTGAEITIPVRVTPRGGRAAIEGVEGGELRIRLASPPVDGAANRELLSILAKTLNLPKRNLTVVQGERSRFKVVQVTGLAIDEVRRKLLPEL